MGRSSCSSRPPEVSTTRSKASKSIVNSTIEKRVPSMKSKSRLPEVSTTRSRASKSVAKSTIEKRVSSMKSEKDSVKSTLPGKKRALAKKTLKRPAETSKTKSKRTEKSLREATVLDSDSDSDSSENNNTNVEPLDSGVANPKAAPSAVDSANSTKNAEFKSVPNKNKQSFDSEYQYLQAGSDEIAEEDYDLMEAAVEDMKQDHKEVEIKVQN